MMRHAAGFAIAIGLAMVLLPASGLSSERIRATDTKQVTGAGTHKASPQYRRGPQVKGFVQRRGGYSYSVFDVINTYGDNRSRYGGASTYRDGFLDRQTVGGPFDHGFFFDSGIGPRGGNSPYQH